MLASNSLETPVLGLVARADGGPLRCRGDSRPPGARWPLPARLPALGLEDEFAVLGSFVAGPAALQRFAGDAAGQHRRSSGGGLPRAAHHLRARFAAARPAHRAAARAVTIAAGASCSDRRPTRRGRARLAAYWTARDRFIESGRDVRPVARRAARCWRRCASRCCPCCASARTFARPTIRCWPWPTALARTDVAGARALLAELTRVQPARTEAQTRAGAQSDADRPETQSRTEGSTRLSRARRVPWAPKFQAPMQAAATPRRRRNAVSDQPEEPSR